MSNLLDRQLAMINRSGRVRRYHSEPVIHEQTVGEHTYNVLWYVMLLTNQSPSPELLMGALKHDVHEFVTGDCPAPTKRQPGMKEAWDALEADIELRYNIVNPDEALTAPEARILKLADVLDGCGYCYMELKMGNRLIQNAFKHYLEYTEVLLADHKGNGDIKDAVVTAQAIRRRYFAAYATAFPNGVEHSNES